LGGFVKSFYHRPVFLPEGGPAVGVGLGSDPDLELPFTLKNPAARFAD